MMNRTDRPPFHCCKVPLCFPNQLMFIKAPRYCNENPADKDNGCALHVIALCGMQWCCGLGSVVSRCKKAQLFSCNTAFLILYTSLMLPKVLVDPPSSCTAAKWYFWLHFIRKHLKLLLLFWYGLNYGLLERSWKEKRAHYPTEWLQNLPLECWGRHPEKDNMIIALGVTFKWL